MGGGISGVRLVTLCRFFRSWPFSPTPSSNRANIGRSRGGGLPELPRAAAPVPVPSDSGTIDPRPFPVQLVGSTGYSNSGRAVDFWVEIGGIVQHTNMMIIWVHARPFTTLAHYSRPGMILGGTWMKRFAGLLRGLVIL